MTRTSLALVSVLLIAFLTTDFRFGRTSIDAYPSFGGRGEVSSNELEHDNGGDRNSDVVALHWDVLMDANPRSSTGLQNGKTGDSTSESTYCNTWCMLKQSLGLTIVGLLLICIRLVFAAFLILYFQSANSCNSPSLYSPCVMWKNEGRHVNELRRIDFCKNKAVLVPNANLPSDEDVGQLVHFVGEVSVGTESLELSPGPLNITTPMLNALVIRRTCMIYQKFEQASRQVKNDRIGAGQTTTTNFTISEDWVPLPQPEVLEHFPGESNSRGLWDELVAHSGNTEPADPSPTNFPPNMPPQIAALLQQANDSKPPNDLTISNAAHVGEFGLTRDAIMTEKAVFQTEWMPLPVELVPNEVEHLPELRKDRYGNLTSVEEGDQPANGDVMIKYEYVADGFDVSFIVQQVLAESDPETGVPPHKFSLDKARVIDDKCCGKFSDDLGVIWMVRRGRHDLQSMITMAVEEEKMLTKILRLVCWMLLVGGWMMLFSIFTTLLSTLPIIGTLGSAAFFIVALIVGTVCCCGVTAIAYIRFRPFVAVAILACAGAIGGLIIWQLNDANQELTPPNAAPAG